MKFDVIARVRDAQSEEQQPKAGATPTWYRRGGFVLLLMAALVNVSCLDGQADPKPLTRRAERLAPLPDAEATEPLSSAPQAPPLVVPSPTSLAAVWGSGPDDVWAAGSDGVILHYDGKQLVHMESGVTQRLMAVHGTGPDDVWFVGDGGTTLHFDGERFNDVSEQPDETLLSVWSNAPDDVWAVGAVPSERVGVVRHWDGDHWEEIAIRPATSLWEIWSDGPDDVWIVGTSQNFGGIVLHATGTVISQLSFEGKPLRGVWGSGPSDVWVQPYDSPAQHWDGSAFAIADAEAERPMMSVWGSSAEDVWAVGLGGTIMHYDGSSWTRTAAESDTTLWSVWGSAPDDVWVVGGEGTVLRWNGEQWAQLAVAPAAAMPADTH